MPLITISYTTSMFVVVDLDAADVQRVVVGDEAIERKPDDGAIDYHDQPSAPVTAEDEQTAYEIAEHSTWPSWDFGW
jgi:hypothetical protein